MNAISSFAQFVLAVTIIAIVLTSISALRNRIIFKMSLRNSYRRIGTTFLVVLGSMVGTALITGSQVINDSYENTSKVAVKETLGEIDLEIITTPPFLFSEALDKGLIEKIANSESVDDVTILNTQSVSFQKIEKDNSGILKGQVSLVAADWDQFNKFGDDDSSNNKITEPELGTVYIPDYLSEGFDIEEGDKITIFILGNEFQFEVSKVFEEAGSSGYYTFNDTGNLIISREDFSAITNVQSGTFNTILVSHTGGLFPEEYEAAEFREEIQEIVAEHGIAENSFSTVERKDALTSQITENGTDTIFAALSIFGIFAGGLLIINIYLMLAEERKSEMGILRAIAFKRFDLVKAYAYEGLIYSLLSSLAGTILGVGVGYLLVSIISMILNDFLSSFGVDAQIIFGVSATTLLISFSLGMLITYFTVLIASIFVSRVNIVSAIRETDPEPHKSGLFVSLLKYSFVTLLFINGLATYLLATPVQKGLEEAGQDFITIEGYMWYLGFALTVISAGMITRRLLLAFTPTTKHKKISWIAFTVISALIFAYSIYAISAEQFKESIQGNPMYLLLVGMGLVFALTIFITYNLNLITKSVTFLFTPFKRTVAVLRIALKYPAENQTRTGLTLAMYAIIIFIVFFISIYRSSLDLLFTTATDAILGGYDGLLTIHNPENREKATSLIEGNNSIETYYEGLSFFAEFPEVDLGDNQSVGQNDGFSGFAPVTTGYTDRVYVGADSYFESVDLEIEETIGGLAKEDVWERLLSDPNAVVISGKYSFKVPFYPAWKVGDEIEIEYPGSDQTYTKTVIASLGGGFQSDLPVGSILMSNESLQTDYGSLEVPGAESNILFDFKENANIGAEAKELKGELAKLNEFNITVAQEITVIFQAFINQFIYLMQGFLSFGLLVGLAGLAVIMTRSVHERRQQIGMLRSLGFTRRMILASFILEASLIGLLGIFIGAVTGSIGGIQLISTVTEDFENFEVTYPTTELLTLALIIYTGTLIFAALPALSAAKLEPVEATNYPE